LVRERRVPLLLSILGYWKKMEEMEMEWNERGAKCGNKDDETKGAEAFVGPDLARFGLHAGHRAVRLEIFSKNMWVLGPTDGSDAAFAPQKATHCLADYERFDVRRDICAHLHLLPLLAPSVGVLG
jgi:hypothetical protein